MSTNATSALPLHGLRVLEMGHIVAGPAAGLILADLGADVIKIERPGEGDQSRAMPAGTAANFHFLNRNKRSLAVDLKGSSAGRELFLRLVAKVSSPDRTRRARFSTSSPRCRRGSPT